MSKEQRDQQSQEMMTLISQWESSGKSQLEFIREYNLKQYRFYYWLKKYRRSTVPQGFVPVQVIKGNKPVKPQDGAIVIRYPNGTSIHLPFTTPVSMIRTLAGL